ncbi:UNVERIFIED_CONTAM: hypothetical protein K2H54_049684 [Gekko kuhli]
MISLLFNDQIFRLLEGCSTRGGPEAAEKLLSAGRAVPSLGLGSLGKIVRTSEKPSSLGSGPAGSQPTNSPYLASELLLRSAERPAFSREVAPRPSPPPHTTGVLCPAALPQAARGGADRLYDDRLIRNGFPEKPEDFKPWFIRLKLNQEKRIGRLLAVNARYTE